MSNYNDTRKTCCVLLEGFGCFIGGESQYSALVCLVHFTIFYFLFFWGGELRVVNGEQHAVSLCNMLVKCCSKHPITQYILSRLLTHYPLSG